MSERQLEPLKAVSTVIELKPGKQYLFVCKGATPEAVRGLCDFLGEHGINGACIDLGEKQELQVVEAPTEQENS